MEKKNKSRAFDHLGMKALALFLAFLLWVLVMNVTDVTTTRTIYNVPVTKINGETLDALGMVYDVIGGDTVDIIVKGPRSLVDPLTTTSFYAVADLSKVSITNTVQIIVTPAPTLDANRISFSTIDDMLSLSIEEKAEKDLPVKIITTGDVAPGYALGTGTVSPNFIKIEGPGSVVDRVTEVRAVVSVFNHQESFEVTVIPSCFDAYGEAMTGKNITLNVDEVKVTLPVNPVKEVPVVVTTRGTVAEGYRQTGIKYDPEIITIAGDPAVLDKIDSINIDDISVDGISEELEKNVVIDGYLPQDVYLADINKEIAVSVSVEPLVIETLAVVASDIELTEKNDALQYTLTVPTGYGITVSGLEEVISGLNVSKLSPTLNVGRYGVGTYMVLVEYLESEDYEIKNVAKISLTVKPKGEMTSDTEKTTAGKTTEKTSEPATE